MILTPKNFSQTIIGTPHSRIIRIAALFLRVYHTRRAYPIQKSKKPIKNWEQGRSGRLLVFHQKLCAANVNRFFERIFQQTPQAPRKLNINFHPLFLPTNAQTGGGTLSRERYGLE